MSRGRAGLDGVAWGWSGLAWLQVVRAGLRAVLRAALRVPRKYLVRILDMPGRGNSGRLGELAYQRCQSRTWIKDARALAAPGFPPEGIDLPGAPAPVLLATPLLSVRGPERGALPRATDRPIRLNAGT